MGYTTSFWGDVKVDPPLNAEEVKYLHDFNRSRRMKRGKGSYYANPGSDGFGQDHEDDIIDYNFPPDDQPSLWCQWAPTDDGSAIAWDDGEKFYGADEWMKYIIDHFLKPGALAKNELPFLQANHVVNGTINAQGEDSDDRWQLIVRDNVVFVADGEVSFNTLTQI